MVQDQFDQRLFDLANDHRVQIPGLEQVGLLKIGRELTLDDFLEREFRKIGRQRSSRLREREICRHQ